MQRILTIAILVIGASFLMAADPPASSSDKSPANPSAVEQPAAPPAAEAVPEGMLVNTLGWAKVKKKTGVGIDYYINGRQWRATRRRKRSGSQPFRRG